MGGGGEREKGFRGAQERKSEKVAEGERERVKGPKEVKKREGKWCR
jgi:hypothetical protein